MAIIEPADGDLVRNLVPQLPQRRTNVERKSVIQAEPGARLFGYPMHRLGDNLLFFYRMHEHTRFRRFEAVLPHRQHIAFPTLLIARRYRDISQDANIPMAEI
ncbi:hypothetical protein D3C80_1870050 [compost metagenome]